MENQTYRCAAGILAGLALFLAALTTGCAPKPAEPYSVRGMVVSVEPGEEGKSQVTILHEAIPGFKNQAGTVVGMEPMAMTFTAAPSLGAANLQPRTKIHFVFEVHWDAAERLVLKEIHPLDAETPLEFNGYSVEMA